MKRSTWITLAIFALLLAAWLVQSRHKQAETLPPLSIDGYIGNVDVQEARALAQRQPPPYTHIVVSRQEKGAAEVVTLDKLPDAATPTQADATPPEAKWQAKRVLGGKETAWRAQAFRATTMCEQLQRSIRSNFAVQYDANRAAEYGLDPAQAIDIELSGPTTKPVKLRVGLLQKADDRGDATTWVADPQHPGVAYQLVGRDLRTAFDVAWKDLRDRQLLALDLNSVDKLELDWPGAKAPRVVVTRPAQATGERPWTITEPAGVRAGDIDTWLQAIGRISVVEFVDATDPIAQSSGLRGTDVIRLTISNGAQKTVLAFGAADATRANKDRWLQLVGQEDFLRVAGCQADQILLTLDQLRDRHVLGARTSKDVQTFTISGPKVRISANLDGDQWTSASPNIKLDFAKLKDFLSALDNTKVDWVASLDKKQVAGPPEWTIQLGFANGNQQLVLSKEEGGTVLGSARRENGDVEMFSLSGAAANQLRVDLLETKAQ